MGDTSIGWTDRSVNPIRARLRDAAHAGLTKGGYGSGVGHYCEKVGKDCGYCYSSGQQPRFGLPEFPWQDARGAGIEGDTPAAEPFWDQNAVGEVLSRRAPTKWFWCDMTDFAGRWVPDEWIDRMFAVAALTPQHTHQFLTKRIDRMVSYMANHVTRMAAVEAAARTMGRTLKFEGMYLFDWPLPNVWLGTSIGVREAIPRALYLELCPAVVHFVSLEPIIEDLGPDVAHKLPHVEWAILGCESRGPRAGRFAEGYEATARKLNRQLEAVGTIAVFNKQMPVHKGKGRVTSENPDEWPTDLRAQDFPNRSGWRVQRPTTPHYRRTGLRKLAAQGPT